MLLSKVTPLIKLVGRKLIIPLTLRFSYASPLLNNSVAILEYGCSYTLVFADCGPGRYPISRVGTALRTITNWLYFLCKISFSER